MGSLRNGAGIAKLATRYERGIGVSRIGRAVAEENRAGWGGVYLALHRRSGRYPVGYVLTLRLRRISLPARCGYDTCSGTPFVRGCCRGQHFSEASLSGLKSVLNVTSSHNWFKLV